MSGLGKDTGCRIKSGMTTACHCGLDPQSSVLRPRHRRQMQLLEAEAAREAQLAALRLVRPIVLLHEQLLPLEQAAQDGLELAERAGAQPCGDDGAGVECVVHEADCRERSARR